MRQKNKKWFILSIVLAILIMIISLPTFAYRSESDTNYSSNEPRDATVTEAALEVVTPTPTEAPTSAQTRVMEYDSLGRLIKITYSSGLVISYTYDSVGNIIEVNTSQ